MARQHDREIEDEHYGVLIPYANGRVPDALLAGLRSRRPDLDDISVIVPQGWDELQNAIGRFVDVGASKFVVIPMVEPGSPADWVSHLHDAADVLLPLQN